MHHSWRSHSASSGYDVRNTGQGTIYYEVRTALGRIPEKRENINIVDAFQVRGVNFPPAFLGSPSTLEVLGTFPQGITFSWTADGVTINGPSAARISHTFGAVGNYEVCATVSNGVVSRRVCNTARVSLRLTSKLKPYLSHDVLVDK